MVHKVHIEGFWPAKARTSLPDIPGIYFVFRCVFGPSAKAVEVKELLYIGKAEDQSIRERVSNHEKNNLFAAACKTGEDIGYAYAEVDPQNLDLIENALVFAEQPPLNNELKDRFNHGEAFIRTSGYNLEFKHKYFFVKDDDIADIDEDVEE